MAVDAAFNARVVAEFRANGGQVGGGLAGVPLALVTISGRRSGQPRVTPLNYVRDDVTGDVVIIASNAGAAEHPNWYHNLVAQPDVFVEVGTEAYPARAEHVDGAERERLYALAAARLGHFTDYAQRTTREIPVIRLRRVAS